MPKLSILIPTFNRPTEFGYLISTLIKNMPNIDYEIIIRDHNPESDGYVNRQLYVLEKYSGLNMNRVHVYRGENCSEIRFRPELIKLASGDYIWFIDDDCIVDTLGLSSLDLLDNHDIYTLDGNQFFMEDQIYDRVFSYNLYDIIFKRELFNYDDFINKYPDPWEFKIGGDKELMKAINFYNSPHFNISNRPVIVNLYRRNGDNLMLNN